MLFIINFNAYSQTDNVDRRLFIEVKKGSGKSDAEVYQAMGIVYLEQKDSNKAEAFLKKAVSLDPRLYQCWYRLGLLNVDNETGYFYFMKATEANPNFPTPYYWMAYYRCRTRKDNEAVSLFKKYIKIAGNNPYEVARTKVAKEVIDDLLRGKEGKNLSIIRGKRN